LFFFLGTYFYNLHFFVRFYDENGEQSSISSFPVDGKYQLADKQGSFELLGDRLTLLGVNMYAYYFIMIYGTTSN